MSAVLTETHRPAVVDRVTPEVALGVAEVLRVLRSHLLVGPNARSADWMCGYLERTLDCLLPKVKSMVDMEAISAARYQITETLMGKEWCRKGEKS